MVRQVAIEEERERMVSNELNAKRRFPGDVQATSEHMEPLSLTAPSNDSGVADV
jgi:hypothetical protein